MSLREELDEIIAQLNTYVEEYEALPVENRVDLLCFIKDAQDSLADLQKTLKTRVVDDADLKALSKSTKSGGFTAKSDRNNVVQVKGSLKRFAEVDKLFALMEERDIAEDQVFDEKVTTKIERVLNVSKIQRLVELGFLSEEEVETFHKKGWTVTIKPDTTRSNKGRKQKSD